MQVQVLLWSAYLSSDLLRIQKGDPFKSIGNCPTCKLSEFWGCSEAWRPSQFQEKTLSEWKGHSSELWESSGVFSEQLSEFRNWFSECKIPFSEWHLTTWATRKPQFSEQLSEPFPELMGNPHERFSFDPAFSERFFKNWGGPPRTRVVADGLPFVPNSQRK